MMLSKRQLEFSVSFHFKFISKILNQLNKHFGDDNDDYVANNENEVEDDQDYVGDGDHKMMLAKMMKVDLLLLLLLLMKRTRNRKMF